MKRVGVTGGIGGGKSVVSRFLRILGYSVYDSDEQAKALMARSSCIQEQLSAEFGADIYVGGVLNRTRLAERVFADKAALQRLNAIVHPAVKADFAEWCRKRSAEPVLFIESAILLEAGFFDTVDEIWLVTAPEAVRVNRVIARNHCSAEEAISRIRSQMSDAEKEKYASAVILNDGEKPLIPQIFKSLSFPCVKIFCSGQTGTSV